MDPTLIAGLATGGSNIIDTGVNAVMQGVQNKKNRQFAEKMYNRQRADALSDWNMQNSYNAPSAQMERLKAAKLNPNLIYGTGVQATGLSGSVRASSAPAYKGEAPQIGLGNAMAQFVDTKMKQQQMDVMKSVISLNDERKRQIIADTLMKGANTGLINTKNAASSFQLGINQSLKDITLEMADWKLRGQKADVTETYSKVGLLEAQRVLTTDENGRRERLTEANIDQKLVQNALMIAQKDLAVANKDLTEDRSNLIRQEILTALKSRAGIELKNSLLQSELNYQTIERAQSWLRTIIGGMKK